MNPELKAEIKGAVAKWRPRLHLMDWSFAYAWESEETNMAKVVTEPLYRRAKFHFAVSFPDIPDDAAAGSWLTLEKTIVHELAHVVLTQLDVHAQNAIRQLKSSEAAERQALERVYDANEYVTEAVACIVWEAYEKTPWEAETPQP